MTTPPEPTDLHAAEGRSLGQLVAAATQDLSSLMRKEVELAKLETKQEIQHAVKGGVGFGIAAFGGLLFVLFGSAAGAYAIAEALESFWAGFLIVAGGYLLVALLGALLGVRSIKKVGPPTTSIGSVKSDIAWAKHPTKSPAEAQAAAADTDAAEAAQQAKQRAKTVKKAVKDQSKAADSFSGT